MLDPEYLNSLPEPIIKLYEELEDWIIEDIARRLKKYGEVTATAEHQTEILRALDISADEINKRIAETLQTSKEEVERLFNEAYERSKVYTEERLPSLPTDGSFKKEVLDGAIKTAQGDIANLTRTAGFIQINGIQHLGITNAYRQTLSSAALKVSTGATDYNTAIRDALRPFTERGIVNIYYDKDGKIRRRSIEVAVRQCVMQGARDMSKAYMQGVAQEIGADGWEISAHLNCAPDHEPYQGRQYSNEKYEELNNSLARPIGTLNCRHMAFPIILGVSEPAHSEQELLDLKAENDKGVTYEGKYYTLYEASQQQRKLERSIRKTKRELLVSEQLGDKDDFTAQSIRLRRLREYYNDFSNKCKLTKREDLLSVGGYGHKISGKAVGDAQGYYKYWSHSITYEGLPKNLAGYYDIKYNNKDEYELLQGYVRAIEKGDISPLIGFDLYKRTAKEADNKLVGLTMSNGITIESYTPHFIDRVIGQTSEPHSGMRQGVQIDDVKDTLLNPITISEPQIFPDGDIRIKIEGKYCSTVISTRDKRIIQTNLI